MKQILELKVTKYNEKIENEVNSEDEEFENDIVELNVSGSTSGFAVKLDLLRSVKDSILEQMFKKEVIHKLPKLENKIFIVAEFILWIACFVFLLKSKMIGVQLLYILIAINIFNLIYGGDQIYTPLFSLLSFIEGITVGMTLYLVTFSSIKNSFK